jgi:formamidopyrimidine-DNA glycosylase
MPEVAEIALTAEILEKYLKHKNMEAFDFVAGKYQRKDPVGYREFVKALPLRVDKIDSHGKFMWFELSNGKHDKWYIWNTFGLTGMWSFFNPKYCKAVLTFNGDKTAYFSDMRNFGTFKFSNDRKVLDEKINSLGPDLLKDENFHLDKIKKIKIPIVKILMDQGKVGSGIGNYLVSEILYRAHLSPHRLGTSLSDQDVKNLTYWIKYVVKLSYVDNHIGYMVNLDEESDKLHKKNYHPSIKLHDKTFDFLVYRKRKDPDGHPVKAEKIIGSGANKRTTYWVPAVQH